MTVMQRVRGRAEVVLDRTGLRDLRQQGSAKAMLPRVDGPEPEVVFLNTAGGVTGGDRLDYAATLGPGTRATICTQTAERAYRASGGAGEMSVALQVGAGGHLDWLGQETILFDGSNTRRRADVHLSADATLLMIDMVVLGRAAMGEAVGNAVLDDRRRVFRDGHLIHCDHLHLTPAALADPACLRGAVAVATVVLVAPDAADLPMPPLPDFASASAWDGRLVVRAMYPDARQLRRAVIRAIVALRGRPMPRVWQAESDL